MLKLFGAGVNGANYSDSFSDIVKLYVVGGVDFDNYKQKCLEYRRWSGIKAKVKAKGVGGASKYLND